MSSAIPVNPANNLITAYRLEELEKTSNAEKSIVPIVNFFAQLVDPRRVEWLNSADKGAVCKIVDLMGLLLESSSDKTPHELALKTYKIFLEKHLLTGVALTEKVEITVEGLRRNMFNKTILILANPKFVRKLTEKDRINLGNSISQKIFEVLKTALVEGTFHRIENELNVKELIELYKFSRHNGIKNVELFCLGKIKHSMGRVIQAPELVALLDFWTKHRKTMIPTEEIAKISDLNLRVIEINIAKILTFLDLEELYEISSDLKGKIIRKFLREKSIPYQESESKAHTYDAKGIILSLDQVDKLTGKSEMAEFVRNSVVGLYVSPNCFQMTSLLKPDDLSKIQEIHGDSEAAEDLLQFFQENNLTVVHQKKSFKVV